VNAVELYMLGRKLMKIAEDALPKPPTGGPPTSVRMILIDVAAHPDSSVGEIVSRTGFPQSHVSAAIARLRNLGALVTSVDERDNRRTLVRIAPGVLQRAQRAAVPVDSALAAALGSSDQAELDEVTEALDGLAARLMPANDRTRTRVAGQRG
jgi:DNA-binding MarR family transcriptional regulator